MAVLAAAGLHEQHEQHGATPAEARCVNPQVPTTLPTAKLGAVVPAVLLRAITAVCPQVQAAVGGGRGAGGYPNVAVGWIFPQPNRLPQVGGKPTILYVGGEFCPYCAAERWALLNALTRFGSFRGITYMRSAEDDGDIATVSFAHATYTSPYLSAVLREVWDRDHNHFQTLSAQDRALWTTFGDRRVPYIDINGLYRVSASDEDVDAIDNLSWSAIARGFSDPHSAVANWLLGKADALTAALCTQTGNQPTTTCQAPEIQTLEPLLW